MATRIEFVASAALGEEQANEAAELARQAFEDFYALFTSDRRRLLPALAAQFREFSELNQLVIALENGKVVGIGSYYDVRERPKRQMAGMRLLLEAADDHIASAKRVREFSRNFEDPGERGAYISRFAVAQQKRGGALASELLQTVESVLVDRGLDQVSLHVRRDNARGIGFYRKCGFRARGDNTLGYLLLGKDLSD